MMDRMETLSEQSLCLQDFVSGVSTSQSNQNNNNNDTATSHVINHTTHHHVSHDSLAGLSAVTAATSAVLGHHHGLHDVGHHVGVGHHVPILSHEPLEKLKRGKSFLFFYFNFFLHRPHRYQKNSF